MVRKIFRAGNSLVVSIPQDTLSSFGLTEGAEVEVTADQEHGGILVKPVAPQVTDVDPDFVRHMLGFVERYRPALEELARE